MSVSEQLDQNVYDFNIDFVSARRERIKLIHKMFPRGASNITHIMVRMAPPTELASSLRTRLHLQCELEIVTS